MNSLPRLTPADQTAAHLRERLGSGQWGDKVPGVVRLSAELHVSQTTVRAALRQLEAEDLIRNPPRLTPSKRHLSACCVVCARQP